MAGLDLVVCFGRAQSLRRLGLENMLHISLRSPGIIETSFVFSKFAYTRIFCNKLVGIAMACGGGWGIGYHMTFHSLRGQAKTDLCLVPLGRTALVAGSLWFLL